MRVACGQASKTMKLLWNVLGYDFRMVDATTKVVVSSMISLGIPRSYKRALYQSEAVLAVA